MYYADNISDMAETESTVPCGCNEKTATINVSAEVSEKEAHELIKTIHTVLNNYSAKLLSTSFYTNR